MPRPACRSLLLTAPCGSRRVYAVLRALVVGIVAGFGSCAALAPATAAAVGSCPNEQVRVAEPYAPALPDCRAYEQVSPVEKNYADALGAVTSVRAAPSGEAVTFDSLGSFPLGGGSSGEGSSQLFSPYLSARGAEGWPAQDLEPAVNPGGSASPLAVTEDLAYTFELSSDEPPLVSEAGVVEGRQAIYMRDNQTGAYRLLFAAGGRRKRELLLRRGRRGRSAGLLRIGEPPDSWGAGRGAQPVRMARRAAGPGRSASRRRARGWRRGGLARPGGRGRNGRTARPLVRACLLFRTERRI